MRKAALILMLFLPLRVMATVGETTALKTTSFTRGLLRDANEIDFKQDAHLDHVYDVRDYGATGNGTTPDTTALQATLDACYQTINTETGHEIFLPGGVYKTGTLTISTNYRGVTIRGVGTGENTGFGQTKLRARSTTTDAMLRFTGSNKWIEQLTFENLCFDGNNVADVNGVSFANGTWCGQLTFKNCSFVNFKGRAISFEDTSDGSSGGGGSYHFYDCRFGACVNGVYFAHGHMNFQTLFEGCTWASPTTTPGYGLYVGGGTYAGGPMVIRDCLFNGTADSNDIPIRLGEGMGYLLEQVQFADYAMVTGNAGLPLIKLDTVGGAKITDLTMINMKLTNLRGCVIEANEVYNFTTINGEYYTTRSGFPLIDHAQQIDHWTAIGGVFNSDTRMATPGYGTGYHPINVINSGGTALPIGYSVLFDADNDANLPAGLNVPAAKAIRIGGNVLASDCNSVTFTCDPNSMNASGDIVTVAFPDTALGDEITPAAPYDMQGIMAWAYVQSAGVCRVVFWKPSAGAVDLANNTGWKLYQRKH
jgi:hypothetical protein